ncbi:MAG: MMPL family transporter [Planctomycetaceae bacterium]|nr:MMPL family transporter [Planctomycetaceae bacterium]
MELQRKRVYLLTLYLVILLPFIGYGAYRAMETNSNSPLDWVPNHFPARQHYDSFADQFGSGDILIISWPGCTLDQPLIDLFVNALRTEKPFFNEEGQAYFENIFTGRELLAHLTAPPISLPRSEITKRFRKTFIGADGQQTSVIVTFTKEGLSHRNILVEHIEEVLQREVHLQPGNWHMAGPVMDGLSVDKAGKSALDRYALPSILLIFYFCFFCLRSWRAATLIFLLSLLASGFTLAFVFYRGEEMSALSIVMPSLVQVLAVSGGIHLVNYYFDALRDPAELHPAKRAFQMGWLPCLLSSSTTAIGLFSLTISELTPIQNFGLDAGIGVLVTTALLLIFIPGYFIVFPLQTANVPESDPEVEDIQPNFWDHCWQAMTTILTQWHLPILIVTGVLMVYAVQGINHLKTSVRIETLFSGETTVLQDYAWLEQHLGPVVPLEILVDFDYQNTATEIERYRLIAHIEHKLIDRGDLGATISPLKYLPQAHESKQASQAEYDAQLNQILSQSRSNLIHAGYLRRTEEQETFRITAFVSALDPIDYGTLLGNLRSQIEQELQANGFSKSTGVTARYTGIMPLVHEIQRQLMEDLFESFISVFIVVTIVMTLVQGGILAGLFSMIPNLFPILLVFGISGWCEIMVDVGSMMTASVALGVAVDDTLHYLTFFRRGLEGGLSRTEAIHYAFHHCGKAMMQTTLICGLGMLIFSLSDFVPTSRFAWMMLFLLSAALVGDLVILPALLLSPIGRLFETRERTE